MHQYLGDFSSVIISVDRLIRMKHPEATRLANNKEKSAILACLVFSCVSIACSNPGNSSISALT